MRLVEQSQRKRFSLEAGSLFAKVAKLTADERFVVATPDAEVEVRGTAFRVTIVPADRACEDGSPTRLEVTEGVVVVRHAGVEHRRAEFTALSGRFRAGGVGRHAWRSTRQAW